MLLLPEILMAVDAQVFAHREDLEFCVNLSKHA